MLKGLGKGLESLIPTDIVEEDFDLTASEDVKLSQLTEVPLADITPDPSQPRQNFTPEALQALADSIREHGILQPIVITKFENVPGAENTEPAENTTPENANNSTPTTPTENSPAGNDPSKNPTTENAPTPHYQIVAGERRWRAAQLAGLTTVPAIVRTLDAQNRLELSIIENAQREDLNPIELATAYAKLKSQFNLTVKDIATRVGKSESSIINTMRLLNLPEEAKHAMVEHNLSEGVMRPLTSASPELIHKILPLIIKEGWTARKVERYIALHKPKSSATAVKVNHYAKREEALSQKYQANVRVHSRSITFSCKNEEELQKLLDKLT